jgi:hypothetical protein
MGTIGSQHIHKFEHIHQLQRWMDGWMVGRAGEAQTLLLARLPDAKILI